MTKLQRELLLKAWKLARAYWFSEEKWWARGMLVVIVALSLAIVAINVWYNSWHNTFYNALNERNQTAFINALGEFTVLATCFIIVAVYQIYLNMMLTIRWRKWMTRQYLGDWLKNQTYYRMKLLDNNNTDNPDQRISEDINLFVTKSLALSIGLFKEVISLISFIIILWQLSGVLEIPLGNQVYTISGYLVWAAIGYAVLGTWLTVKLGRPMVKLNFMQQRYEADFRFTLMRLRENSESVALYKGENEEHSGFLARFQRVFDNYWQLMRLNKKLTWLTSGYSQISIIFAILVAAPRYFTNQISLGQVFQISGAYGNVQSALSYFVDKFTDLAEWQAVVNRLTEFSTNMEKVQQWDDNGTELTVKKAPQDELAVDNLTVRRPDGTDLLTGLNLQLSPGSSLLVTGPSGCGKSTLLRTLAGIWPFAKGAVKMPENRKVLFLPQKSYLPIGPLREAVSYPGLTQPVSDQDIKTVLEVCNLSFLADRLNDSEDWAQVLSLGEQQRLAFARVLLQQPDLVFLDEATAALDEATESQLYQQIRTKLPSSIIVSVGHRQTLNKYHTIKLQMDNAGTWQMA